MLRLVKPRQSRPSFATSRFHVHVSEGFSVDYAGQRWVVLGGYSDFSGQTISTWTGARLTDGGMWTDNSDRNAKENFAPVDPRDILERVTALPVQQWNYRIEGPEVSHIGPVAQDFYAAFGTALTTNTWPRSTPPAWRWRRSRV